MTTARHSHPALKGKWRRPKNATCKERFRYCGVLWVLFAIPGKRDVWVGHNGMTVVKSTYLGTFILSIRGKPSAHSYSDSRAAMYAASEYMGNRARTEAAKQTIAIMDDPHDNTAKTVTIKTVITPGRQAPKITNVIPLFKTRRTP